MSNKWTQDLPPVGGFPKLNYNRRAPVAISGYAIFGTFLVVTTVTTAIYFNEKIDRLNNQKEEKRRLSMILPILQAENDICFLASPHKNVYYTRWMPPQINKRQMAALPKH
ncbi:hypothetical protein DICPUDRAFT_147037 [Dictyostelium purpureum]|uniref:NADH dehydrogenase [ubiquinone] 1 alpha subcomplex subunit 13 n=1 Tax=Dictyostelium purpureum TaxID=5786 RepID=F0Z7H8_DICPU|nr:uncharacterized protein DICPUDRAFT_147037 [Dictyostelium purpureum]EGC40061.1 hypothetical protein DICPUDRAFT_147037 [Dictyostelium purpureum]|eukprot:XP_003283410.1 hypothetical protein DICPUDRAFT_147037 [Dictyostelium purpureum]